MLHEDLKIAFDVIVKHSEHLTKENAALKRQVNDLLELISLIPDAPQQTVKLEFPPISPDAERIKELNFCWQQIPARARRVLKHYKIKKPSQLTGLTIRAVKKVPNAGTHTIAALQELCAKYGIELRDR